MVTPAETLGKSAVDVPVLKNDSDPDGVAAELKISLPDGNPNARAGGDGNVVVTLAPTDQLVPYTVTDVDGQSATAVIWVPGQGEQHPTLARTDVVEVMAGKEVNLDLNEYVRVREGRTPRITQVDKVRVQGADTAERRRRKRQRPALRRAQGLRGSRLRDLRSDRRHRPRRSAGPQIHPQHHHQSHPGPERQPPAELQRSHPGRAEGRIRQPGPGQPGQGRGRRRPGEAEV